MALTLTLTPEMYTGMLLGMLGGFTRVFIGILKVFSARYKVYWSMTLITFLSHGFVGLVIGMIFYLSPAASLLAGFGGLDVLESIYKIFRTEKAVAVQAPPRRTGGSA